MDDFRIKVTFAIIPWDAFIGFYYNRFAGTLYFAPLPCCVFKIQLLPDSAKWERIRKVLEAEADKVVTDREIDEAKVARDEAEAEANGNDEGPY